MTSTTTGTGTSDAPASGAADLNLSALRDYLAEHVSGIQLDDLTVALIAGGRSNPTYRLGDGKRAWILRRPPYGDYVASGHDMGREVRAMTALRGTDVPVPVVVANCTDAAVIGAPFYVMEALEGRTLRTADDTATLAAEQRGKLADGLVHTLAALHAIDPEDVGLAGWGRPEGYLERQVARWGRQWAAVATTERPEVGRVLEELRSTLPPTLRTGIVHGDFKIDNLMVAADDPTSIVGVLDWEMSTLGDVLADVGLLISFWDEEGGLHNPLTRGATALPGFPSAVAVREAYAAASGADLAQLDWYVAFSDIKIAVILEQIHRRHLDGTTRGDWFDDIGGMVPMLVERAAARLADR